MMELQWDDTQSYTQPEDTRENTRDEVAIAELELGLLEVGSAQDPSVNDDHQFVGHWVTRRLY